MTRYADPGRCPDCRAGLEPGASRCPACGLLLAGPLGQELFTTLTRADELLARMRSASAGGRPPAADHGAGSSGTTTLANPPVTRPAPAAPAPPARARAGLSVPQLLLTVGALCLIVAAVVFLAVTWAALGVGGRTAVLLGVTTVSAVVTAWSARNGLRAGVESLGLVTAGLASLDLVGAWSAGWLGDLSRPSVAVLLGSVLVVGGCASSRAVVRTPARGFLSAQLVAVVGAGTLVAGLAGQGWSDVAVRLLLATAIVTAGSAGLWALPTASRRGLGVVAGGAAAVAGLSWLALLVAGVDRVGPAPTMASAWLAGSTWVLLGAAALPASVAAVRRLPMPARVLCLAAAQVAVAVLLTCPAYDESLTVRTLVAAGATASAAGFMLVAPRRWAAAGLAVAVLGGSVLGYRAADLTAVALARGRAAAALAWDGTPGGRFPGHPAPAADGWLLPLSLAVLLTALAAAARVLAPGEGLAARDRLRAAGARTVLLGVLAVVTAATLALGSVRVWVVVAVLAGSAVAAGAVATRRAEPAAAGTAGVLTVLAVALSAYDESLSVAALATASLLSVVLHLTGRPAAVREVAGTLAPPAVAGLLWSWGALAGAGRSWTALVALLVLAALLLGRAAALPRPGSAVVELACAPAAVAVATLGTSWAPTASRATWLAVYLTVAGAAVSALALLRHDRRGAGWLGGLLLAAASWVRLADLGVAEPEPYTLPSAAALLLVGWLRLRRDPRATTPQSLAPGLALALVPSLLWALDDPLTWRALVLGAACLVLLVGGAGLHWRAPVLWGAAVGVALVVREAAPYVGHAVPRWVLIGSAGTLLTVLGLTWERRAREARAVAGYLRSLR